MRKKIFKKTIFTLCLIFLCSGVLFIFSAESVMADPKLTNPLSTTDIPTLIGSIIKAALGIVGSIALLMFIYGGFLWLMSAGNPERVTKGKNILIWATIGLATIFISYMAVGFVINSLGVGGDGGEESKGELRDLPENIGEYCDANPNDPLCAGSEPVTETTVQCFYECDEPCETTLTADCLGIAVREGPCPPPGECD